MLNDGSAKGNTDGYYIGDIGKKERETETRHLLFVVRDRRYYGEDSGADR